MALRGKTAEEQIYNFLIGKGMTPAGAAGLMGNLYAESGLKPTNIQNSYEKKLGFTDETYTAAVDSGAYGNFVNDSAGYGLAQWTYWSRKKALLEFVKARGASVGDLETQLEFLLHELNTGYAAVLSVLKTTGSVRAASDAVLLKFERPADQSTAAQERRAGYGQTYYNKYAAGAEKGQGTMTAKEKQNRANIVAIAESFFGCKESDGSHKKIIDIYNADKPLARGYPMKYTDAWCACFVSVVSIRGGALAVMPKEVGCGKMIELYQKLGRWQENDAYVPAPGDVVFYDWNDGPNYAATDNTAAPDHVGIVVSVTGSTIKVIEGNMSSVLVILAFLALIVVLVKRGETKVLNKVLFSLVTQAEKQFGGGTGKLKLAAVSDWIYQRIPAVLKLLFSEKNIENMIEIALEEAKKAWGNNENIAAYIEPTTEIVVTASSSEVEAIAAELKAEPGTIVPMSEK